MAQHPRLSRRQLLRSTLALGGLGALGGALHGRPGRAAVGERKFIFVVASGGWDVTRALSDTFNNPLVDQQPNSEPAQRGELRWVHHPSRPSVDQLFHTWGHRALVLNGVVVPSIFHDRGTRLVLTGSARGDLPDWPAILSARSHTLLPHLVLGGPSFPGPLAGAVARTQDGNQLQGVMTGSLQSYTDAPGLALSPASLSATQQYLAEQGALALERAPGPRSAAQLDAWLLARQRADQLQTLADQVQMSDGSELNATLRSAAGALTAGLSRCVTVAHGAGLRWDSHANNDVLQSPLWEELFSGLVELMQTLDDTPGELSATLAEETTVVVLSELGRTPAFNDAMGKHHWPHTSALILGAGFTGGRVVGGFDSDFASQLLDPATGEVSASGVEVNGGVLGATLLASADIDPGEWVPDSAPLLGVLE